MTTVTDEALQPAPHPAPRRHSRNLWALVGQDHVAVALEQGALVSERGQKPQVVQGDGAKRLGQGLNARPHAAQVAFEVDGLGPDEDLERCGLRIQELSTAGKQFLLGSIVGAGQRSFGSDHVEQGHRMGWRVCAEAGDAAIEGGQVESLLHGGAHERHPSFENDRGRRDGGLNLCRSAAG